MNEELKLLYETLKDTANALDYCGDRYEREVTENSRNKVREVLEEFEKKYKLGSYHPDNKVKIDWWQNFYRCPFCDKEHLKEECWIVNRKYNKNYLSMYPLIAHARDKHNIKKKDKPKEFKEMEDWFLSIIEGKEKERQDNILSFFLI